MLFENLRIAKRFPPGLKEEPKGFEKGKKTGWPEAPAEPETYTIAYAYDNNGNQITKTENAEVSNYSYDFENRLITVSLRAEGEAISVSYSYDGDGNRISKTDSSGTIKYINDIALPLVQVLMETDPEGNLLASYTIGNDLISRKTATETIYYHSDALGSIRQLSDPTQTVIATYLYDGFGNLLTQTGTVVNPYLFTGEQQNLTTGLVYLRARYYDPSIGRFISRDPILAPMQRGYNFVWVLPYLIGQPQFLYPYGYARNNPANFSDPSGLAWWDPTSWNPTTYCGATKAGPGPVTSCYDKCCKEHDECLAKTGYHWWQITCPGVRKCHKDLLGCWNICYILEAIKTVTPLR